MWRLETMVLPVHIGKHDHAVNRLAKNRRKDIKLLDTKLSVSRGALRQRKIMGLFTRYNLLDS